MHTDPIIRYYDTLATTYDDNRFNNTYGSFIDQQERGLLNMLIPDTDQEVLDLACGTGRLTNYAKIGIDASPKMIEIATAKHPDKYFHVADACALPFANNTLDIIFAFHFFMHLKQHQVENILAECDRVLKRQGKLIFDIPSKKRRSWLSYRPQSWHGALSYSKKDLAAICTERFSLTALYGLLFLPVHRLPKFLRKYFLKPDQWLSQSGLYEFSSYLVAVLEKS